MFISLCASEPKHMQTEEFAVKKVKVYFKEIMPNPEYRWARIQRPDPPMASSDEFYKGKSLIMVK